MTKYLGYISLAITLISIIIGGALSYGKLEAKAEKATEKVVVVEKKIEDLEKETDETEKSLLEFSVEQKYIKKSVDEVNLGLKELIRELKK